ncbi:hypothetical protein LCGC14_0751120 [marine sediment metagenome]|uniref:Uncharacterized protein n=1 Tax=marine sediment metagenome TaxID=412755 RepID=A0A0F9QNS1_9ZZZZ
MISGFILSRNGLSLNNQSYCVSVKVEQFWRYELAGESAISDYSAWAKQQLADEIEEGDWLEFVDLKALRFRAGIIKNNQLAAVVFIAPNHELPTRTWLSHLFTESPLSDEARSNLLAGKPGAD